MAVTTKDMTRLAGLALLGLVACADSDGGSAAPDSGAAGEAEAAEDATIAADAAADEADGSPSDDGSDAASVPSPRRVFVTSSSHSGDLGGPEGADALCMDRASEAGLAGDFVAWLSTPEADAAARLDTGNAAGFARLDGELVAESFADLLDGELAAPIDVDENGDRVSADVWTGSLASGALEPDRHCEGFTTESTSVAGVCGRASEMDARWSTILTPNCSARLRLYCFER